MKAIYGCTSEQLQKHLQENAKILRKMQSRARGKKYNGFTCEQLNKLANRFESL